MSRVVVVDASVAVKWVLSEDHADEARAILDQSARGDQRLVAPTLLPNEVANAIYQRFRRGTLTSVEADTAMIDAMEILRLGVELLAPADLPHQAYAFAKANQLRAFYDSLYVVLAHRLGVELWTADQRLLADTATIAPWVRWLGDYPADGP